MVRYIIYSATSLLNELMVLPDTWDVKHAVVVGPCTTAEDLGTLAFAAHSIFGFRCLMVEAFLPLLD